MIISCYICDLKLSFHYPPDNSYCIAVFQGCTTAWICYTTKNTFKWIDLSDFMAMPIISRNQYLILRNIESQTRVNTTIIVFIPSLYSTTQIIYIMWKETTYIHATVPTYRNVTALHMIGVNTWLSQHLSPFVAHSIWIISAIRSRSLSQLPNIVLTERGAQKVPTITQQPKGTFL